MRQRAVLICILRDANLSLNRPIMAKFLQQIKEVFKQLQALIFMSDDIYYIYLCNV